MAEFDGNEDKSVDPYESLEVSETELGFTPDSPGDDEVLEAQGKDDKSGETPADGDDKEGVSIHAPARGATWLHTG